MDRGEGFFFGLDEAAVGLPHQERLLFREGQDGERPRAGEQSGPVARKQDEPQPVLKVYQLTREGRLLETQRARGRGDRLLLMEHQKELEVLGSKLAWAPGHAFLHGSNASSAVFVCLIRPDTEDMKNAKLRWRQLVRLAVVVVAGNVSTHVWADAPALPSQGVRANVLWPIYPGKNYRLAYRQRLSSSAGFRTDGLLGFGISTPRERDTEGRFSEASVTLGVRQFLASPFHLELQAAIGRSKLLRHVTENRDYRSTDVELMALAGYEWMLASWLSLDVQAGIGRVVSKSNPWPIYEDATLTNAVGEQMMPIGAINLTFWF